MDDGSKENNDAVIQTLKLVLQMGLKLDRALEELHNVKVRLTNLEENVAASNRRMDRFDERLERIERQSDIADTLIEQLRRRANDSKK